MKQIILSILTICSVTAFVACSHTSNNTTTEVPQTKNFHPAENRKPANTLIHLEQTDKDKISNIILKKNTNLFQQLLLKIREAQTLVSSFDVRLAKISKEAELDELFQSNLYCKLWQVQTIHEHAEDQLHYALKFAKSTDSKNVDWIYQQISFFAKSDISREIAMEQLFKGFVENEIELCGSDKCIENDLNKITSFSINPLNKKDFFSYVKKNKSKIASYSEVTPTDLRPGDCFYSNSIDSSTNANSKRKPQATGFDWTNRNWVGSVLPEGQFVFTYDDGPHATFTRAIRNAWADAGLPKPAFFWLRQNVSRLPDIVKELNDQGYVIGSHSERHADLGNLAKAKSPADFNGVNKQTFGPEVAAISASGFEAWKNATLDREINKSVSDLSTILGKPVRYFRLPYGSGVRNDLIGARFQALNLDHFFWRIDSLDWQDKDPESIRDRVVAQMQITKKGIVLFHDIHPQSAASAKLMVNYLKASSTFKAVSIHDIPGLKP